MNNDKDIEKNHQPQVFQHLRRAFRLTFSEALRVDTWTANIAPILYHPKFSNLPVNCENSILHPSFQCSSKMFLSNNNLSVCRLSLNRYQLGVNFMILLQKTLQILRDFQPTFCPKK